MLEAKRGQRDRLVVPGERNRTAREMHDVVAHSLAVIVAQADGGSYAGSCAAARTALATVGAGPAETRRVLGLLRDTGPVRQPGVHDIPELIDNVRARGLVTRAATARHPTGGRAIRRQADFPAGKSGGYPDIPPARESQ